MTVAAPDVMATADAEPHRVEGDSAYLSQLLTEARLCDRGILPGAGKADPVTLLHIVGTW
jgi:hypothetical protein